jgi:hypothetical protein
MASDPMKSATTTHQSQMSAMNNPPTAQLPWSVVQTEGLNRSVTVRDSGGANKVMIVLPTPSEELAIRQMVDAVNAQGRMMGK